MIGGEQRDAGTATGSRRRVLHLGLSLGLTAAVPGLLCRAGAAVAQASDRPVEKVILRISASNAAPYVTPQRSGFEDRLFTEIFRRLGIEVRIYDVPSQRGLQLLNAGEDDGTLARNPGMAERYPNMVQFSEKALDREYLVFTKRPDIAVDGWDSLAGYHVGIVNGWKILERNITKAASLTKVRDGRQLFRVLGEDRVDLAVFNRWGGLYLVRELGLSDVKALSPPLARRAVFFYLHKRHAALAERASEVLREMKRDGSYKQLVEEVLGPLTS